MQTKAAGDDLARLTVNTIKMLSADGVEKANSGHPGLPMGAADYSFVLWTRFLTFNPKEPGWANRDRFVLSAGHGSMLLYSLLHLSGFDVSLEDLANFRQWGSRTPGHPERNCLPGVEVTSGPLGQGVGNIVGLALGQKMLAARVNTAEFPLIDHHVYGICSDGDLMEGVSTEAASLAGHLGLGNIVLIYDDNHISIDGPTEITFSEDVGHKFEALGWHIQRIDGHDHAASSTAIEAGIRETGKPSLIVARTHIAHGSPSKQDTSAAHGAALGADEIAATKEALGWPEEPTFHVPDEVRALFKERADAGRREYNEWTRMLSRFREKAPERARVFTQHVERTVPDDIAETLLAAAQDEPGATRGHGAKILQTAAAQVPALVGGAADLVESTKTFIKGSPSIARGEYEGRNIRFGIREHAMGAIANGLACYGSFIPFASTFLIFSDYMRPSIRLAALSELQVVLAFTHDSIMLGEDGPTHQPVEHLSSLRAMPNMHVVRPADAKETALAWAHALKRRTGPTTIVMTRQGVPALDRSGSPEPFTPAVFARGGHVLLDSSTATPRVTIIATGSEVAPAVEARGLLEEKGIATRVVSMPCVELFESQPPDYRKSVVPDDCDLIVVVEAASPYGWHGIAGRNALVIGVDRFGFSAPWKTIAQKMGFTGPAIADRIEATL